MPDRIEQGAESKFTAVPLGGMCVQCIVVTQRIQHTYLMLSEVHCLSSPYVFILCARIFLHTNKPKFESSHYFDLIPLSVTHLMFYSYNTHSFKQFLSYVFQQIYNPSHSSSPAQPPEGSASLRNLGMTSMLHTDVKGQTVEDRKSKQSSLLPQR